MMSTARMLNIFTTPLKSRLNNLRIDPSFDIGGSLETKKQDILKKINDFESKTSTDSYHAEIQKKAIDAMIDELNERYKEVSRHAITSKAKELIALDEKVKLLKKVNTSDWTERTQTAFKAVTSTFIKQYETYHDATDKEKDNMVIKLGHLNTVAQVMPAIMRPLKQCKPPVIPQSYASNVLSTQIDGIETRICSLINDYSPEEHESIMRLITQLHKELHKDSKNSANQTQQFRTKSSLTFCGFGMNCSFDNATHANKETAKSEFTRPGQS